MAVERQDLAVLLMQLAAAYRVEISKYQAEVWYEYTHELPAELCRKAVVDWIVSQERFPTIAEFRRHVRRLQRREREFRRPAELTGQAVDPRPYVARIKAGLPEPVSTPEPESLLPQTGGCRAQGPHKECVGV